MARDREPRTYRFEPLDTSGVFLGLGIVQSILLGGGLVVGVVGLSTGAPLPVAAMPLLGGAALSFARVGGRPAWEWLPLSAAWLWMRLGRGQRWFPRLPLVASDPPGAPLPPCLDRLSIAEIPWRGQLSVGAVRDAERQTLAALVPVSGPQFVVASAGEQERLLEGWGEVLNQFARERSVVTHLGWSDFARPSGMAEHLAWLEGRGTRADSDAAAASYDELVGDAVSAATEHEILLTVTVARARLPRRELGLDDPEAPLARALASSLDALARSLRSAALSVDDPLTPTQVRQVLRTRIAPDDSRPGLRDGRLIERLGLVSAASAGPVALEAAWSHVRVDGAYHRTFWVASWPRLAVPPSWLEPFLAASGVTRSMTVVFHPVPSHQARRRIERGLVKLESDADAKEGKGRRVDARHQRATQALLEREQELVAGYAEMAYAGLVTVSATSEEELDDHATIVEQLAREAGLELRSLDGRQDLAWAAALPLGLAPKTLVG